MKQKLLLLLLFMGITIVNAQVANPAPDLMICDVDNDGFATFDLTVNQATILGGQNPNLFAVTYHLTQSGAQSGVNAISAPTSYLNVANPEPIYVRVEENATGNYDTGFFNLIVNDSPQVTTFYTLSLCDDDFYLPANEFPHQTFDLTTLESQITSDSGMSFSYFLTGFDASTGTNSLADQGLDVTNYQNTVNPQDIFVRVENPTTGCFSISLNVLKVLANPTPLQFDDIAMLFPNGESMESCENEGNGPGTLQEGYALFDLTEYQDNIIDGETVVSATYYITEENAELELNAIANPSAYYNITPYGDVIWVRVTNTITGCFTLTYFDISLGEECILPQNNFTIESISETCVDANNGAITIAANAIHDYEVSLSLNGNSITIDPNTFTEDFSILNLAPGTYYLCITATDVNATQCFDVYVEAVENLAAFSGRTGNTYTLNLTGSKHYEIDMNGEIEIVTTNSASEMISYTKELTAATTDVIVKTDKDCQGIFEERVSLEESKLTIYPNPVSSVIYINSNTTIESLMVYDVAGKIIMNKNNDIENLDVSSLRNGLYFIQVRTAGKVLTSKIIKQ